MIAVKDFVFKSFKYGCLVGVVAGVGGCAVQGTDDFSNARTGVYSVSKVSPPTPQTKPVGGSLANDPLQQHLKARKDVDPTRVNKKNRYTKNVADSDFADNGSFRVLRLEPQLPDSQPLKTALSDVRAKNNAQSGRTAKSLQAIVPAAGRGAGVRVQSFRTGQHPGRTRLVLDVNAKTPFTAEMQNGGRALVVRLPSAGWSTDRAQSFAQNPLVQSYQLREGAGGGSEVVVSLRKPGKLVSRLALKPNEVYNNHRIVLDVAPL